MTTNLEERHIINYLKTFLSSFEFDPTGEEKIEEFLKKELETAPFTFNVIKDVHHLIPWEIQGNFIADGLNEYYFFIPRDRKYTVGHGAERVDRIGYWESSGQVPIYGTTGLEIGSKKVLSFYQGQHPDGNKTPWIMHEYKARAATTGVIRSTTGSIVKKRKSTTGGDVQLDEWVICKIYMKAEEIPAATTTPSATLTAATTTPSATLTAAAENRLNIIQNTATRVENTAIRATNSSMELIEGSGIKYDTVSLRFWNSKKCLAKVFKRAEE